MIDTRLMQYFLAVAKEQNITKAAKVLHITQPTLSRQMAMLEKEIGATLFIKGSRPLSLTNEGYLLRRRAEEVLDLLAKTEAEVSCGKEELEGTVTIGCGEIAAVQYLAKIIEKFHEIHPLVVFDIYTANADQIRQRMDEGLSDIGLLLEPSDIEQYEYIRMPVTEKWAAIVPSGVPLSKRNSVTAEELAKVPVIMPSRKKVHAEVANWFGKHYEHLNIAAVSNLSTNSALLVEAGLGYALTIEGALPFLKESRIRMIPLSPELTATSVLAWKRQLPFSSATEHFLEFFRKEAEDQ